MKSTKSSVMYYILGIVLTILLVLLQLAVLSELVLNREVQELTMNILLSCIVALASFTGNCLTCRLYGEKSIIVTIINISVVLVLLLLSSLFIEGNYQNILLRILAVVVGGMFSYVFCQRTRGKSRMRKRRYR